MSQGVSERGSSLGDSFKFRSFRLYWRSGGALLRPHPFAQGTLRWSVSDLELLNGPIDGINNGKILTMKSTIDAAGRVVIPKAIRAAARLEPGTRLRFRVTSAGVLEIEPEPLEVVIQKVGRLAVAQPRGSLPVLKQAQVDSTLADLRADTADR